MRNQIAAAERLGIRAHTVNSTNREEWETVRGLLEDLDEATRTACLARLRAELAEHATAAGVVLGSRAWLVTAQNANSRR